MTREEYLTFCKVCKNRSFDPKFGITCSLTGEIAKFDTNCENFLKDPSEIRLVDKIERETSATTKKTINKGRNTLFIVGGFYVLVGIYEAFFITNHMLLFGIIDWFISAVFIGLAFWSYKQVSTAMITGLIFYLLLILFLAILDLGSLFSGILWKVLIIMYLFRAIKQAREYESKMKVNSGDLLDQL